MFVVNYKPALGRIETFGFFNTAAEAIKWMKADVDLNVKNAAKNYVDLKPIEYANSIEIVEYGTWYVTPVTPAGN